MNSMCELNPNLSIAYEIEPEDMMLCYICYSLLDEKEIVVCSCSHKYCKECILKYLEACKEESKYFPIKCLENDCNTDIFKIYKHLLPINEYKRLKSIRKIHKFLKTKNIFWCNKANCQGYSIISKGKRSGLCTECSNFIYKQADSENKIIKEEFPVAECPKCNTLIYKDFLCLNVTCWCGTQFCLKCGKTSEKHHQNLCFINTYKGKISWWIVIMSIYSYMRK